MDSKKVLLLFLGIFLLTAPFIRCEDGEEGATEDVGEEKPDDNTEKSEESTKKSEDSKAAEDDEPIYDEDGKYIVKWDGPVMVLDVLNFEQETINEETRKPIILVEFYAPWCGHCKALAPQYEAAAARLAQNDPPVVLAKVNAVAEEDLANKYEVSGYPTLKIFRDGEMIDYDGPRTEDGIVKYMEERADPDWKPPPEAVVTLTDATFDEAIASHELILVEFYAPWCGHCKRLAPEYEKAAKDLKYDTPPIVLAKVDATEQKRLSDRFNITGYPTLKFWRKGKMFEYTGTRDKDGIVEYMRKQAGDASREYYDTKDMKHMLKYIDDVLIIGFFEDKSSKLFNNFMEAANALREDFDFMHSFDPKAREMYNVKPNSIVVFKSERYFTKYEPKWHTYNKKSASMEMIIDFVKKHQTPLVGQYNNYSKNKRYKEVRPLIIFFYTVDWSNDHKKATQQWRQKFADVAKDYKDLTFVIADEDDEKDLFNQFGFDESSEELNIGIMTTKDRKYPMEPMEEYDEDELRDFIEKFKAGNAVPKLKSQKAPKKQKGPVKVVVGTTFDKIVKDPKKDVLIEFYAPWCGHCKNLEPIYKDLAQKYKKEKNLVIAKIDATANEFPEEYPAEGFPTIYFAPSNNKDKPIKHEGERDLKGLVEFMEQHATVSLGKNPKDEL